MGKLNILIKFGLLLYFGLVSESFLLFLSPFNVTKKLVLQEIWPKKLITFCLSDKGGICETCILRDLFSSTFRLVIIYG